VRQAERSGRAYVAVCMQPIVLPRYHGDAVSRAFARLLLLLLLLLLMRNKRQASAVSDSLSACVCLISYPSLSLSALCDSLNLSRTGSRKVNHRLYTITIELITRSIGISRYDISITYRPIGQPDLITDGHHGQNKHETWLSPQTYK